MTVLEDSRDRIYALYQRRLNLILPLKSELNPQAFAYMIQEFNVELVEIYAELYDLRNEDMTKGTVKRTKAKLIELNGLAKSCIETSKEVTKVIYAIEDEAKYDYLQAVLNMEL